MLSEEHIEGRHGIYEEHIEGGVVVMEGLVDALGKEHTAKVVRAPRMHELGGSPHLVPTLSVEVEHPEVESLGEQAGGGDTPIAAAIVYRLL